MVWVEGVQTVFRDVIDVSTGLYAATLAIRNRIPMVSVYSIASVINISVALLCSVLEQVNTGKLVAAGVPIQSCGGIVVSDYNIVSIFQTGGF